MKSSVVEVYIRMALSFVIWISIIQMSLSLLTLVGLIYLGLSVASTLTTIGGMKRRKK
jgi:hypothetical protein